MEKIRKVYKESKKIIKKRIGEFREAGKQGDDKIFAELAFCLLTPQSKARCCWDAIEKLVEKDILYKGKSNEILKKLNKVRFKYKKAIYITLARQYFLKNGKLNIKARLNEFTTPFKAREWLVKNIKGLGYKEASHFLRNIGMGQGLAILDRHILKNMRLASVINEIPDSMAKKDYLEIEKKLASFAKKINIPMEELDLVLWCKETGEVFK